MAAYNQEVNIDNTTLIKTDKGVIGLNLTLLTNKQDIVDYNLITDEKTIVGAINELSLSSLPTFTLYTTSITNIGVISWNIIANIQFKKGNNIYTLCSSGKIEADKFRPVNDFGKTWIAYLNDSDTSTIGTNITAEYINGDELLENIDCFTTYLPNPDTLIVIGRKSGNQVTISFDISGLA